MIGVVLGGARSVDAEFELAKAMCARTGVEPVVFAINDKIPEYPGRCHAVTLHFDKLPAWLGERRANGFPDPLEVWAASWDTHRPLVTRGAEERRGSSGMLAIEAARAAGCGKVLLCGVPMVAGEGHFKRGMPWDDVVSYQTAWTLRRELLAPIVRSFSGWTAHLFGAPTDEFISK
jgi:hypothetical protein